MLQFFSIKVYALLYTGTTLSFVTPLVARMFDILSDICYEPFMVTTAISESVIAKRVYINYPIMFPNIVIYVEL